jgi:TolB-like protein
MTRFDVAPKAWFRTDPAPRLSVVVMPFANLSGNPQQDYLADVITEGLTTNLARIRDSFVIARSTAFTYKGKPVDVRQVGRDLGVRYVLEGSAEQVENRVRVNAQLIDASTGAHLWADQFDAQRSDMLQMQDEIVTRLSRAMEIELTAVDIGRDRRISMPRTSRSDATQDFTAEQISQQLSAFANAPCRSTAGT